MLLLPTPPQGEERLPLLDFINPNTKQIQDEDTDLLDTVVAHYTIEEESTDKGEEETKKIDTKDALHSLDKVRQWCLQ